MVAVGLPVEQPPTDDTKHTVLKTTCIFKVWTPEDELMTPSIAQQLKKDHVPI
jgi:hypothetical protein